VEHVPDPAVGPDARAVDAARLGVQLRGHAGGQVIAIELAPTAVVMKDEQALCARVPPCRGDLTGKIEVHVRLAPCRHVIYEWAALALAVVSDDHALIAGDWRPFAEGETLTRPVP